jgi:hypothetical protein
MGQCPYPESFTNPISGKTESNSMYMLWHEGYEAHKLELLTKGKCIEIYVRELAAEVRKIKELRRELEKRKIES